MYLPQPTAAQARAPETGHRTRALQTHATRTQIPRMAMLTQDARLGPPAQLGRHYGAYRPHATHATATHGRKRQDYVCRHVNRRLTARTSNSRRPAPAPACPTARPARFGYPDHRTPSNDRAPSRTRLYTPRRSKKILDNSLKARDTPQSPETHPEMSRNV